MAKFYLIILILLVFAISVWIRPERGAYPIIISNLSLLAVGILAHLEGVGLALIGMIIAVVSFLFYIIYANIKFTSVLPTFIIFGITPVVFGVLRAAYSNIESLMAEDVEKIEADLALTKRKDEKLSIELKALDQNVSEIANLYEITKEMSSTLLFSEIFKIFSEFLTKNFEFKICKLILINQDQDQETEKIEKIYKIENPLTDPNANIAAAELVDVAILKEIAKTKMVIFWEDFIAIPLITKDKIIGVLNVEGLDELALEKFLIVSRQFSLEIEKVQLYETVQELAITDGLTGMFVRRYFMERFKEEFERSSRHNFKLSFLMVDLDDFKKCNDQFGHLVGDVILKEVANVLRQNVREIDLLGRYGGEEFSLLLPETDREGAALVAERLRWASENKKFKAYDEVLKITISIGGAVFPGNASTSAGLIEAADAALYAAKAQGRNRVVFQDSRAVSGG